MARELDPGGTDYLAAASGFGLTAYPISLSAWFNADNETDDYNLVALQEDTNQWDGLVVQGSQAGDPILARSRNVGDVASATKTDYAANTWNQAGGTYNTASRFAYLNGVAGSEGTTATASPAGYDTVNMGTNEDTPLVGFDGEIAEVGVWSVILSAGDMAALAAGFSPLLVQTGGLRAYWPLWGNNSPEVALKGGVTATINGTVGKTAHPRVIMPFSQF